MDYQGLAQDLVETLKLEGISDPRVLSAIAITPRHLFVPPHLKSFAYLNEALPIGDGQTISQPYVVAKMTEALIANNQTQKVLEVGTGSGYQSAVLARIFDEVYTIERIKPLLEQAEKRFLQLKLANIHIRFGDGTLGWQEHSPYNAIIVTAAANKIPEPLLNQMAENARMVIPIGETYSQELQLVVKQEDQIRVEHLDLVMFVPLLKGTIE